MTLSSDKRWNRVIVALVLLSSTTVFLAGLNITLIQEHHKESLRLKAAEIRLAAADDLHKAEQRAATERAKLDCKNQIAATELGNKILASMRKGYVDLADVATKQDIKDALIEDANALPVFPLPKCAIPKAKNAP